MKIFISVFLTLLIGITSKAQNTNATPKRIWQSSGEELQMPKWKAQWIWLNDTISSDVMLARKTFDIPPLVHKAVLRITASSQYQLYINGNYIKKGPARSAPHHQSFDIFEISELLKKGQNVIAIRVHQQKKKFSYNLKQRGGLLAQLDIVANEKEESIFTNSDWKVSNQPSWDNNAPVINRFQQFVNDRIDMRKHIKGWEKIDFNASSWSPATPLFRTEGWPAVQKNDQSYELATPWISLVAREIPYTNEKPVRATHLIQASQIELNTKKPEIIPISKKIDPFISKKLKKYLSQKAPLEISKTEDGNPWFLLFDFEEIINGTPILEIEGKAGTKIEIVGAPYILNEKFTSKIVYSEYHDEIILSGKKDHWEATYFKPTRYLGLIIHNSEAPVKLTYAGTRQIKYPFNKKGSIASKEAPWIEQYMNATAKTIDVCTTDAYTDNYRERRQYAQTGYYAALGNAYLFGDTALQRRYLIQTAQEQQGNGIMPAYAPAGSDDYMVILDSNCLWIRSLRNYLLYSGDYKTTKELLPSAQKLMKLLDSFTNNLGLIDSPPYPYWLDHALLDRRGANFTMNAHYLGALDDFAQLLEWLNKPESKNYKDKATLVRESLQKYFWNDEKQLFTDALIDRKQSKMFSEHSNASALALAVATQEQAEKIAKNLLIRDNHNYIKRESGLIMVTPAMSYYLHKGLCEYGYIDASFEMFRSRFDKMLAPHTNGTLWEEWRLDGIGRSGKLELGKTRSDAQTESAFAPSLFAEYLIGIQPTSPGMKEVEIHLSKSNLKNIEGVIPSPEGNLVVKWNIDKKGNRSLQLNVPNEMIVKLNINSLEEKSKKSIYINKQLLNSKDNYIELSKGNHEVLF